MCCAVCACVCGACVLFGLRSRRHWCACVFFIRIRTGPTNDKSTSTSYSVGLSHSADAYWITWRAHTHSTCVCVFVCVFLRLLSFAAPSLALACPGSRRVINDTTCNQQGVTPAACAFCATHVHMCVTCSTKCVCVEPV